MSLPLNMEIIVNELQNQGKKTFESDGTRNIADKNRWIEVKDGWNNYIHTKDKENLLKKINALPLVIHKNRLKLLPLKKNTDISKERQQAITDLKYKESEVAFERIISKLNTNIYNQLCIGNGNAESIDLIYSSDGKKKEKLIEFKTNSNTPLYGMIELIKNYCLLSRFGDEAKNVNEIVFLAPKDYFIKFKNEKSVNEFFKTIEKFNSENNFNYSIKYIDIDDDLCKMVINQEKFSKEIYELLLIENWKKIKNPSDWLKI